MKCSSEVMDALTCPQRSTSRTPQLHEAVGFHVCSGCYCFLRSQILWERFLSLLLILSYVRRLTKVGIWAQERFGDSCGVCRGILPGWKVCLGEAGGDSGTGCSREDCKRKVCIFDIILTAQKSLTTLSSTQFTETIPTKPGGLHLHHSCSRANIGWSHPGGNECRRRHTRITNTIQSC